jgi:hypothetical protein
VDDWKEVMFVLVCPTSDAFAAEQNPYNTAERVIGLQRVVVDFLSEKLLSATRPNKDCTHGVFYVKESIALVNLLVLDDYAFVFFRGFTKTEGPAGQVIVKIQLSKCPQLLRELFDLIQRYYIGLCKSDAAISPPKLSLPLR